MVVNVHILYLFSHCVSFALLIIDFIVILHVRLIRVLLKINQSIRISASFPKNTARLAGRFGSGPRIVGRIGLGVRDYGLVPVFKKKLPASPNWRRHNNIATVYQLLKG